MPNPTGGTSFQLQGFDKVKAALTKLGRAAPKAAAAAIKQEAEEIMTASKELVPVDTGSLRDSGHVTDPEVNAGTVSVELAYGGPAAPYALYVHEIPPPEIGAPASEQWQPGTRTAQHVNGEWKYLEKPFKAAEAGMADRLAERLRGTLIEPIGGGP